MYVCMYVCMYVYECVYVCMHVCSCKLTEGRSPQLFPATHRKLSMSCSKKNVCMSVLRYVCMYVCTVCVEV